MIGEKVRSAKKVSVIAALLLVMMLVHPATAQLSDLVPSVTSFCAGSFGNPGVIPPANNTFIANYTSINNILFISLLILLTMAAISGLIYAFGYSFRINNLLIASRQEFGEIAVTAIIIFVLVGTFTLTTSISTPTLLQGTGAYNQGTFVSDCNSLTTDAFTLYTEWFNLGIDTDEVQMVESIQISLQPDGFGISFSPFKGYASSFKAITWLYTIAGEVAGLLLGVSVGLGIFYAIMPLFLFAGIILRTMPWSRAAGGAFLGLFIGFYIVFPILLHFMLVTAPSVPTPLSPGGGIGTILNYFGSFGSSGAAAGIITLLNTQYSITLMLDVLVPTLYAIFAVAFSFLISFDFAEASADFLGSPGLHTSHSLNKLL